MTPSIPIRSALLLLATIFGACSYSAKPAGGVVFCGPPGGKRCPDSYICLSVATDSDHCVESCWPAGTVADHPCRGDAGADGPLDTGSAGHSGGAGGSMTSTGGTSTGGAASGGSGMAGSSTGGSSTGGSGGCIGGTSCPSRSPGDGCNADGQCASLHCVEGVCCDSICSGQCESCTTAGKPGMCSPATAPRAPCKGSGTCGGHCDPQNRASCSYPGPSVPCGLPASCSNGVATTAAICNGSGDCAPPATSTCVYGCQTNVAACATRCPDGQAFCGGACVETLSSPLHCGSCDACGSSVPKCLNGKCVQCSLPADCPFSGAGCSNNICICRQKSTTNVAKSPGFDAPGALSSWVPQPGPQIVWDATDADACPTSGSMKVAPTASNQQAGGFVQCLQANENTDYSFGFRFKQDRASSFSCFVLFYGGSDCGLAFDPILETIGPLSDTEVRTGWTPLSVQHKSPVGTKSVTIRCSTSGVETVYFDQIYLNSAGNSF